MSIASPLSTPAPVLLNSTSPFFSNHFFTLQRKESTPLSISPRISSASSETGPQMTSRSSPTPSTSISTATIAQARLNKFTEHMSSSSTTLDGTPLHQVSPLSPPRKLISLTHIQPCCSLPLDSSRTSRPNLCVNCGISSGSVPSKSQFGSRSLQGRSRETIRFTYCSKGKITLSLYTLVEATFSLFDENSVIKSRISCSPLDLRAD